MLGVVLWSDAKKQKAIIWCEDQGDLAYYGSCEHNVAEIGLGEGDLIQFDLSEAQDLRLAKNPKRIAEHYCSDIKDVVMQAGQVSKDIQQAKAADAKKRSRHAENGILVNLDTERKKRGSEYRTGVAAK